MAGKYESHTTCLSAVGPTGKDAPSSIDQQVAQVSSPPKAVRHASGRVPIPVKRRVEFHCVGVWRSTGRFHSTGVPGSGGTTGEFGLI